MFFQLVVKKMIARLVFPLPLALFFLGAGILLQFVHKKKCRHISIALMALSFALLFAGGIFGGSWLSIYEHHYAPIRAEQQLTPHPLPPPPTATASREPPLAPAAATSREPSLAPPAAAAPSTPVYTICVFGNGAHAGEAYPRETRFGPDLLVRLGEGARLARWLENQHIEYQLVVSMQSGDSSMAERLNCVQAFMKLADIPPEKVSLLPAGCVNSRLEMMAFKKYDGVKLLVSNAYHLPRLVFLAKKLELSYLPAPAGFTCVDSGIVSWMPSADNLRNFQCLVYELLGTLEYLIF